MNGFKAALIKLYLHLCALLPLAWARALGRSAVRLYWPFGGRSRKVTQRNIEMAFPDLSPREQQQLAKRSLGATGELVSELGHVWIRPWEYTQGLVKRLRGKTPLVKIDMKVKSRHSSDMINMAKKEQQARWR